MEQDFIVGLYESVGMSVGAEFSSKDVSQLYRKVFHVPSNAGEAHTAMQKMSGGDDGWSCTGENVFDVLLEMEREREKKEQLYWDLQLLNTRNLNNICVMDKSEFLNSNVLNCLHRSTKPDTFTKTCNKSDFQMGRTMEIKEDYGNVRRLEKAARQCWARLASEGVQSIVPTLWEGKGVEFKGQAWGCVSLSEVLLLLAVKYDAVTNLLYTEMLQEHHTPSIWKTLLPWKQYKEHEELEDRAEEILVSGDMLHLAELPGAFRIYRTCLGASFTSSPESREQTCSAISLLFELHASRQQEIDTLTGLGEWLDRQSMRLLCLHIKLATLRAQREKISYSALLAARQCWETWPRLKSPCRAEQAAFWLQDEEEETNEHLISASPQQESVLKLLVLTQEQERKHLVKLVQKVSLENLHGAGCTVPPNQKNNKQTILRNGCIKRLRQIYASLQTPSVSPAHLEKDNLQIELQAEAQLQMQDHVGNKSEMWSQHQLENYALLLLTCLLELQEVQVAAILPKLVDMSAQDLELLQAEFECELQAQRYTNLVQLLMSDEPLTSDLIQSLCPKLDKNSSSEQMSTQSCCTGPAEPQYSSNGAAEALKTDSVGVQTADVTNKQDVCTGCGAVMEELPYLEILCFSDATCNIHQSLTDKRGAQEEEDGSTTKSPKSYEKQGSLITLAWSKPPDDDTDYEAGSADGGRGQSLDSESSVTTQVQASDISSTTEYTQCEETSGESYSEESGCRVHHEAQCADQQCSTEEQLTLEESSMADQPQTKEAMSGSHLQTHTLVTTVEPHLFIDPCEELCSELSREITDSGRVQVETCQTATESDEHDLTMPVDDDLQHTSQTKTDCDLTERETNRVSMVMEREQVWQPVSAIERERTMRDLVEVQRKVEQRQQRDKERQLLRIQERLSIIQSRKAEEDLLGLKHTDRLKHLTQDLPQEDQNQQKMVVRERLEQLRRERSYVMQSKRARNTAGFKELLGPVALHSRDAENETNLDC